MKIMLIVSCLEWLTCLFLLIMVEFKSCYTARTLKEYSFLLLRKSSKKVQCSNEFVFHSHMRFCVTQWSATRFRGSLSLYSCPLPSEEIVVLNREYSSTMLSLLCFLDFFFKPYNLWAVKANYDYCSLQLCQTAGRHTSDLVLGGTALSAKQL